MLERSIPFGERSRLSGAELAAIEQIVHHEASEGLSVTLPLELQPIIIEKSGSAWSIIMDERFLADTARRPLGPEGRVLDSDGREIAVIAYAARSGHVCELELIKEDGSLISGPNWSSFSVPSYF